MLSLIKAEKEEIKKLKKQNQKIKMLEYTDENNRKNDSKNDLEDKS